MGGDLQWGTDLMEEAGCIWQVKTREDESDARVLRTKLSGRRRLKGRTRRPSGVLTIDVPPKEKRKSPPLVHRTSVQTTINQSWRRPTCRTVVRTPARANFASNLAQFSSITDCFNSSVC